MEKTTPDIRQKIGDIQLGLLRYKHNGKKVTLPVKIAVAENNSLSCVLENDAPVLKLANKNVTLIQKDHENYMYIGGRISQQANNTTVLSVNITKACWFIRQTDGSVSWLQEKCIYMPPAIHLAS